MKISGENGQCIKRKAEQLNAIELDVTCPSVLYVFNVYFLTSAKNEFKIS